MGSLEEYALILIGKSTLFCLCRDNLKSESHKRLSILACEQTASQTSLKGQRNLTDHVDISSVAVTSDMLHTAHGSMVVLTGSSPRARLKLRNQERMASPFRANAISGKADFFICLGCDSLVGDDVV